MPVLLGEQQPYVDRLGDRGAAGRVGMQVIARVVGGQKAGGLTGIAQDSVGVDDAVENAARADPLIERDALGLVLRRIEAFQAGIAPMGEMVQPTIFNPCS